MTVGRRSEVPKAPSREGSSLTEPGAGRSLAAWRAARGFRPWPLTVDHGCPGRPVFTPLPGRYREAGHQHCATVLELVQSVQCSGCPGVLPKSL
jgi:hypothetical protein